MSVDAARAPLFPPFPRHRASRSWAFLSGPSAPVSLPTPLSVCAAFMDISLLHCIAITPLSQGSTHTCNRLYTYHCTIHSTNTMRSSHDPPTHPPLPSSPLLCTIPVVVLRVLYNPPHCTATYMHPPTIDHRWPHGFNRDLHTVAHVVHVTLSSTCDAHR